MYTWLGKLFTFLPIGDVAHRVNLMSATLGAGTTALLYDIRPDVRMPMAEPGRWASPGMMHESSAIYSTVPVRPGQQPPGPWGPSLELVEAGGWSVPVLVGQGGQASFNGMRQSLVLYEIRDQAPELAVREADPDHKVGAQLNGLELLGYDLDDQQVERGGSVHLTFYWRVVERSPALVLTAIDGTLLETHELGFGNLRRYVEEFRSGRDSIVVEDYHLVLPSTLPLGDVVLQVGTTSPLPGA